MGNADTHPEMLPPRPLTQDTHAEPRRTTSGWLKLRGENSTWRGRAPETSWPSSGEHLINARVQGGVTTAVVLKIPQTVLYSHQGLLA